MYKIYMLCNNFNNKCYIGVTKNSLKRRFDNGKCCIGKRKTCGGFHWEFVKEDDK